MAGQKLEPMSVNNGDPVTAELMQNIIANINIVNSLSTSTSSSTPSAASGGYGAPATPTVTGFDSGRKKVSCKKDGSGGDTIYFSKTFSKVPNIVCSVWNPSASSLLTLKYMPVVTSFTATEFTFRMVPIGATAEGSVYITWNASLS